MASAAGSLTFTAIGDVVDLAKTLIGAAFFLGGLWSTATNVNPPSVPGIVLGIGETAVGAYLLDPRDFQRVLGAASRRVRK